MHRLWLFLVVALEVPFASNTSTFLSYFADIEVSPLEKKDTYFSFSFYSSLSLSETYTTFSLFYNGNRIAQKSAYPGIEYHSSFLLKEEDIVLKEGELVFMASSQAFTIREKFITHPPREEKILVLGDIENRKSVVEDVIQGVDHDGNRYQKNEEFAWNFPRDIYTTSCYIFDLSLLTFSYEGDIENSIITLLFYGTEDDFPRLLFDEEKGGYSFKGKLEKENEYYRIRFDEEFFVDEKTHMISRSSGDYFLKTSFLYFSNDVRKEKSNFPFQLKIENIGKEKSTFILEENYIFLYEPYGNFSDSVFYIVEEDASSNQKREWETW